MTPPEFKPSPVAAMIGIAVVMMLIALDQTVVGTALPQIVAELLGFDLYPWVAAAYLLTNAILIPVTGRLGDLHGRKPYLLASIALFTLASALCGLSASMLQLVLFRGLQGIGGGMLIGSAFASVGDLFPKTLDRVRWQVMLTACYGIASAMGPALGGWMTEHMGWRSVFYVNLPLGLIALPIVWRFLPRMVHCGKTGKAIDWLGVLLMTLAIGTLLLTTELGARLGFASPGFWGLVSLAALLGGLFLRHQKSTLAPIIPPQLWANQTVRRLAALSALTGLMMFVLLFYAPLLLQGGFSFASNEAGLIMTPLLVSVTLGSMLNGQLIPRLKRPERLFSYGVLVLMIGLGLLCTVSTSTSSGLLMAVLSLCGLGLGFQLPNLTLQMQSAVGREDQGAASALIHTLRSLGSMFGASVAGLLVQVGFNRAVTGSLKQGHIQDASVLRLLDTPQVLLRAADQSRLADLGQRLGFDAAILMEHARLGLVSGVRFALLACVLLAVASYFVSRR